MGEFYEVWILSQDFDYIFKVLRERERKEETDMRLSHKVTQSWYHTTRKQTQVSVTSRFVP